MELRKLVSHILLQMHCHKLICSANEGDAHAWRSQTLRMLLPATGANASDGEKYLRAKTETTIARFAEVQTLNFMNGPARYLLDFDSNDEEKQKELQAIYQQAGTLSYRLWTQRTDLRCTTLRELGRPNFDADNEYLTPHSLVRYDDHEDQLKGKPITLIVHPLIQAFGTNEGKDYGSGRIWACAEVWLDSK
jgi:hypothetical protein